MSGDYEEGRDRVDGWMREWERRRWKKRETDIQMKIETGRVREREEERKREEEKEKKKQREMYTDWKGMVIYGKAV